jgi:hypothetical protein
VLEVDDILVRRPLVQAVEIVYANSTVDCPEFREIQVHKRRGSDILVMKSLTGRGFVAKRFVNRSIAELVDQGWDDGARRYNPDAGHTTRSPRAVPERTSPQLTRCKSFSSRTSDAAPRLE